MRDHTGSDPARRGGSEIGTRDAARLEARLSRLQSTLKKVRLNERVLAEQVAYLRDVADAAETRKLVAQTPLADREWRDARTDLDRHSTLLDEARQRADELLAERDELLEQLFDMEETR